MVNTFDLARARQAVKKAKRARKEAENRAMAAAVIGFEPARARHKLRQAESAVKQMLTQLVASRAGRIDFAMVRKIGAAETRVAEAREALRKIDPTSAA
jgi:hypothetical protein